MLSAFLELERITHELTVSAFLGDDNNWHSGPHRHEASDDAGPLCSTQRADRELRAFISGPAAFVGGVPLTRAMIPWAMPEAST
jgi:hypothetical protein